MNFDWKVGEVDAETWCYEDLGMLTYMLSQALWNLNFFSNPLRWDQQEANCSYDYIHRSICKDHKVFFNLYILNLFHKSGLREGRGQFHHCRGLKRYFWLKFFFFFSQLKYKNVHASLDSVIAHFLYFQSSSAYGVRLCFSCAAKCRSPGDSVICDGVLCRFPIQS